jgi:leucyl-tRNA synthetase
MITVNKLSRKECNKKEILEPLIIIISPFAPHLCEELWNIIGNNKSVSFAKYPNFNSDYLVEDTYEYPLMINGKLRAKQSFSLNTENSEIEKSVLENETIKKWLDGKKIKKIIIVPNKVINIVS